MQNFVKIVTIMLQFTLVEWIMYYCYLLLNKGKMILLITIFDYLFIYLIIYVLICLFIHSLVYSWTFDYHLMIINLFCFVNSKFRSKLPVLYD